MRWRTLYVAIVEGNTFMGSPKKVVKVLDQALMGPLSAALKAARGTK